jgi:TonB family protein
LVLLLIQFPQLLRGGMYHHFRPLSILTSIMEPNTKDEDKDWRTIAVLRAPMIEPSAATLKKYLRGQDEKGSGPPPVVVRLTKEESAALQNMPPVPRVKQEPKNPVMIPSPGEAAGGATTQSSAGQSTDASSGSNVTVPVDPNAGKKATLNLPPPGPSPKTETAANAAPSSIPNGIKAPANSTQPSKDTIKVFEDEQKAIHTPGTGFFDTKGFPLGDYVDIIKEKIKGNWFIPSNLRNSQGHTTVIFYIGKDGRFTDARIEASTSSGNTSLNLAALKAIIDSNPFPPLPKNFPGDHVGAKFVLSYNEP